MTVYHGLVYIRTGLFAYLAVLKLVGWAIFRAVARDVFSGDFFYGFFRRVFLLPRGRSGLGQLSERVWPGPTHGSKNVYRPGKKSGQTHFFFYKL
jgi:hypothetical protein